MTHPFTRLMIVVCVVLLALEIVRLEHKTSTASHRLCYGIHGYLVDNRQRAESRLGSIQYYRDHPDELRVALRNNDADIARFARLCKSL